MRILGFVQTEEADLLFVITSAKRAHGWEAELFPSPLLLVASEKCHLKCDLLNTT